MKIVDELINQIGDAEVIQKEDKSFYLLVKPKIVEDLYQIQNQLTQLKLMLNAAEKHAADFKDTNVGKAVGELVSHINKSIY